jgi:hypothetical protein
MGLVQCTFHLGPNILEIQNLPLLSSYGSGPKIVYFTTVYVLYYRLTCTAHLKSNFAKIWCASIFVAYLGISDKTFG